MIWVKSFTFGVRLIRIGSWLIEFDMLFPKVLPQLFFDIKSEERHFEPFMCDVFSLELYFWLSGSQLRIEFITDPVNIIHLNMNILPWWALWWNSDTLDFMDEFLYICNQHPRIQFDFIFWIGYLKFGSRIFGTFLYWMHYTVYDGKKPIIRTLSKNVPDKWVRIFRILSWKRNGK